MNDDKEPRVTRRNCGTGILVSWAPCGSDVCWWHEPALNSRGCFVAAEATCLDRLSGSSLEGSFLELIPKHCCVCCNFTVLSSAVPFMCSDNGTLAAVVAKTLLVDLASELQVPYSEGSGLFAEELLGSSVAIITECFSSLYSSIVGKPVLVDDSISILGVS